MKNKNESTKKNHLRMSCNSAAFRCQWLSGKYFLETCLGDGSYHI